MSPTLERKLDLTKRSFYVQASPLIQKRAWENVAQQALEEEEEKTLDQATEILTLLEKRPQ